MSSTETKASHLSSLNKPSTSLFAFGSKRLSDEYLDQKYSTPTTEYLEFEGGKIRIDDQGPKDAPALILIHGLMASYKAWDLWMDGLTKEYRVVRMDLPGWGLSDTPTPKIYDPAVHQRAILEILKHKNISKATLVGHSYGSHVAWNLAADYPEIVERLVIVNGLSFPQRVRFDAQLMGIPLVKKSARRMAPRLVIEYVINGMLYKNSSFGKAQRQMYFDFLMRKGAKRTMSDAISWYLSYAGKNKEINPKLLSLKQPILTLWGEGDVWVSYKDAGTQWPVHYPQATHVTFKDAGHLVVDEKPKESLDALLNFLKTSRLAQAAA